MVARFQRFLSQFAILWLAINVGIASVPRCDTLLSFLKLHAHDQTLDLSCHGESLHSAPSVPANRSDPAQAKILAYDLCPCSISIFAYAVLSFENPSDFIAVDAEPFTPFTPIKPDFYENHAAAIDPPYPKLVGV